MKYIIRYSYIDRDNVDNQLMSEPMNLFQALYVVNYIRKNSDVFEYHGMFRAKKTN